MFELRWVNSEGVVQLQFRFRTLACDASGAVCAVSELSEWQAVPEIADVDGSAWIKDPVE